MLTTDLLRLQSEVSATAEADVIDAAAAIRTGSRCAKECAQ